MPPSPQPSSQSPFLFTFVISQRSGEICFFSLRTRRKATPIDVSSLVGEELRSVTFIEDYLELRFGLPTLTLYSWPYVMLKEFSVAWGEPEYRNALCAQIGEEVEDASLEEGDALTIELQNGVVLGLSLREEDIDGPVAGSYSETGSTADTEEF